MGGEDFSKNDFMEDDEVQLPGFRFHPTDEELVGFYLRRQLDKKPIRIELIKQIDIYKYDPWDLPRASSTGGEKEWYFFCKRGRKYKNSIRPNRVTGSGFWKATGIDKPVYSVGGEGDGRCIGLKKTLVYYRGSAGKGTKTDWMMHEFRLPSHHDITNLPSSLNTSTATTTTIAPEAEIWTLCRIFKRNVTQKKQIPDWRSQVSGKHHSSINDNGTRMSSGSTVTVECDSNNSNKEAYINFGGCNNNNIMNNNGHCYNYQKNHHEQKPAIVNRYTSSNNVINQRNIHPQFDDHHQLMAQQPHQFIAAPSSNFWNISNTNYNPNSAAVNDFFTFDNCDELGSVVKFAFDSSVM